MVFRAAISADKDAVLRLFREENRLARRGGGVSALGPPYPQAFDDFVARQGAGDRRYHALVAQAPDGKIVGYVRALHRLDRRDPGDIGRPQARQTTLHKLVVTPAFQGAGLGRALVGEVAALARDLGRDIVRIHLPEGNPLAFYRKLGFRKVATLPGRDRDLDVIDLKL